MISNANKIQNDSHCVLNLRFENSVTEESSKGKTESHVVTNNGGVVIATVDGRKCASFNGTDQSLSIPLSPDFSANRDFSIFFEINFTDYSEDNGYFRCPISIYDGGVTSNGLLTCLINSNNADIIIYCANDVIATIAGINDGNWYSIRVIRKAGYCSCYIDGSDSGVSYITRNITNNIGSCSISIGKPVNNVYARFSGNIRNVSIHKGIARYTKNFTPQQRLI